MSVPAALAAPAAPAPQKAQKVMVQPINLIFKHLQNKQRVAIWLVESRNVWFEGVIMGFDEFMNLVVDETASVCFKKNTRTETSRKELGRILLKGDNITLIHPIQQKKSVEDDEDDDMQVDSTIRHPPAEDNESENDDDDDGKSADEENQE